MKKMLELLTGEAALNSVLPSAYAHYRRPVQGALGVFLNALKPVYRNSLFEQQAMLPPSATAAQRLALLARSCPALHKLGQSLARERRLSANFRHQLQQLESFPPIMAMDVLHQELSSELGPLEALGIRLMPQALAEASVSVVVPFVWANGEKQCRQGVFKVLKPGIAERLTHELDLLEKVGAYLDERCMAFKIPRIDYGTTFEHVRQKLNKEVRLDLEQQHLRMASDFYAGDSYVQIPELFPFCTSRVTAMERVWGQKVTDHQLEGHAQEQLAERVIRTLIARPVLSQRPQSFFHADPHAGNLMFSRDGRLAILDWSLVGWLGEREKIAMVQILLNALTMDSQAILDILMDLNMSKRCNPEALKSVVQHGLEQIRQLRLPGFDWLTEMLDEAVQHAGLGLRADLVLFRKTLHSLEGVVADIGASPGAADRVLLREFIVQMTREWPLRWLKPFFSRSFATRLSSADLVGLTLSLPLALGRFWRLPQMAA